MFVLFKIQRFSAVMEKKKKEPILLISITMDTICNYISYYSNSEKTE